MRTRVSGRTGVETLPGSQEVRVTERQAIRKAKSLVAGKSHTVSQSGYFHVVAGTTEATSIALHGPTRVNGNVTIGNTAGNSLTLRGAGCTINGEKTFDGSAYSGVMLIPTEDGNWMAIGLGAAA